MENFIARYEEDGIKKTVLFDKIIFDKKKAEKWLKNNGIKNFFFFFEPEPPREIGENELLFKGEVGFDITMETILPHIINGKNIILDTYGGDLWESLKIYDAIKGLGINPSIGVLGTCASAGMQILLATENRWMTPNSRGLIHNPWTFLAGDDEVFRKTTKELEEDKMNIAQIYSDVSGKPIDEILSLMKEERILNSTEMQRLNFAKIKRWINDEPKKDNTPLINNENMTEKETKQLNAIEKIINSIKDRLFPAKNLILQDVNGVELDFGEEIETREQIQVGDTATAAGDPANGEFVLNDGTVLVFENGTLMEMREPEEEETEMPVDDLQEEVENLKAENLELQNKLTASNAKVAELKANADKVKNELTLEIEKIAKEFKEFKNEFSGEKPEMNAPGADNSGSGKTKFSYKSKN